MTQIDGGDFSALRLGSDVGGEGVEYDEGHASQTIPLYPDIRRRSNTLVGVDGWIYGILENVHAVADVEDSAVNPYAVGATGLVNGYPASIPEGYDIWLMAVHALRTSASGGLTAGIVTVGPGIATQGWGLTDAGAATQAAMRIRLGASTALFTAMTGNSQQPFIWGDGSTVLYPRIRLPRGGQGDVNFQTESDAAATYQAIFVMGIFPTALGQDVLS